MFLPTTSAGQDLLLRHKRLIFDVNFTGATPSASVRSFSNASGAVFVSTQAVDGVTADDTGANFGTLLNNNSGASTVGILVDGPKLLGGIITKLYSISVADLGGTAGTVSSSLRGTSTSGLTASGNAAFTVSGTSANLDSTSPAYRVTIECQIGEDRTPRNSPNGV